MNHKNGRGLPPGKKPQYVWVPCIPLDGLQTSRVFDANGSILQVRAGTLCILGPTLGIRAEVIRAVQGLHRVKFADGQRAWIRITQREQWDDRA